MTGIPFFADEADALREAHGAPGDRIVTVSGFTGVGTSTIASIVAEAFDLEHVDAGAFFRAKAEEHGMTIEEFDSEAAEIEAETGVDFDVEWDRTVLEYAFTRDDLVLEGRLTGALLSDIAPVRVYVTCDPETVAERMRSRESAAESIPDDADADDLAAYVRERNRKQLARYEEKYGIDPRDRSFYNIVVDNSRDLETVRAEVVERVGELL